MPLVSPDGNRFVVGDEGCGFTQFYEGGTLINAVPGCAVGWIDDSRVLLQTYTQGGSGGWICSGSTHDEEGNLLASPPLPCIAASDQCFIPDACGFDTISPTSIYDRAAAATYDLETGATLATYPAEVYRGTVAGEFIVYPCATGVCRAPQ